MKSIFTRVNRTAVPSLCVLMQKAKPLQQQRRMAAKMYLSPSVGSTDHTKINCNLTTSLSIHLQAVYKLCSYKLVIVVQFFFHLKWTLFSSKYKFIEWEQVVPGMKHSFRFINVQFDVIICIKCCRFVKSYIDCMLACSPVL